MAQVLTALSTSLDGFIAGADDSPDQPLGTGGSRLFDWFSNGDTLLDRLGEDSVEVECIQVVNAPGVTHLSYRVVN
jgi:hypothetical protein